jgi:predicted DNA binding CopG/RHH family protein
MGESMKPKQVATIRITPDCLKATQKEATKAGMTLSAYISHVLETRIMKQSAARAKHAKNNTEPTEQA